MIYSALMLVLLFTYALLRDTSKPISLAQAETYIANKEITKAYIAEDTVYLQGSIGRFRIPLSVLDPKEMPGLVIDSNAGSSFFYKFFFVFLILIFGTLAFYLYSKERSVFSKGRALGTEGDEHASSVVATTSDILFRDVAGIEDVKEELFELISFLKDPNKFSRFGVRMPRGLLLVGPPGVGKTMIAKAVAGEAGVPFYYQSASSFVQIYVGMGAKRVRELFLEAKRNAPAIIFIDEIDAVGKIRGAAGRNDERDATLNQLLTEMDGFDSSSGVVVIAATNKIDVLDDALLRAGRFDRRIFVELPTMSEREAIVSKYLEKIPNSIDPKEVAKMSIGFNGASLATLINEAALKALREEKILVTMDDVQAVKSKVKEGKKRLQALQEEQKKLQANYQAARAFVAALEKFPFEKCTITGEDISIDRDPLATKTALMAELKFYLAGMAMMQLKYGEHCSHVEKDLGRAKKLASDMVKRFGMGDEILGDASDEKRLLSSALKEVKSLLKKYESPIAVLAADLEKEEVLGQEHFVKAVDDLL